MRDFTRLGEMGLLPVGVLPLSPLGPRGEPWGLQQIEPQVAARRLADSRSQLTENQAYLDI